jgi:hypothetical protein
MLALAGSDAHRAVRALYGQAARAGGVSRILHWHAKIISKTRVAGRQICSCRNGLAWRSAVLVGGGLLCYLALMRP